MNILIHDISKSPAAGVRSILQFANIAQKQGYAVRLIVVINRKLTSELAAQNLRMGSHPICDLPDKIEISVVRSNNEVLVSPNDMTVATLWHTAFLAQKMQSLCKDKKFIYFIQDDERGFFPMNSLWAAVNETYGMDFYPMYNTSTLEEFFIAHGVVRHNNPSISGIFGIYMRLPAKSEFIKANLEKTKKRLFVYMRPNNPRNNYDLLLLILYRAISEGILDPNKWDIIETGSGNAAGQNTVVDGIEVARAMPYASQEDYQNMLHTFDVALVMMETPSISTPVFDFSLSGVTTVTNTTEFNTAEAYQKVCKNIIAAPTNPDALLAALARAIKASDDLESRYTNAAESTHPRSFEECFDRDKKQWLDDIIKSAAGK